MRAALLFLNLVASLASAVWAVVALVRPKSLSGSLSISGGEIFYVRMYAARAIPFGLTAAIMPYRLEGNAVAWLLFTAALIQVADVIIAVGKKQQGMIIGASLAAIVHLLCGLTIL